MLVKYTFNDLCQTFYEYIFIVNYEWQKNYS